MKARNFSQSVAGRGIHVLVMCFAREKFVEARSARHGEVTGTSSTAVPLSSGVLNPTRLV